MKTEILKSLFDSERNVMSAVDNLTPEDLEKSISDGWTIGLNLQHIVDIEQLIFESAQTKNTEIEFTNKSEQIKYIMLVSDRKFKAPQVFYPKAPITSIDEFVSKFKSLRSQIHSYIENDSIDAMSDDGHPLFGSLSQHEWFVFLFTHTIRHIRQIENILAVYSQENNGIDS